MAAPATVSGVPAPKATEPAKVWEGGVGDTRVSQETCRVLIVRTVAGGAAKERAPWFMNIRILL